MGSSPFKKRSGQQQTISGNTNSRSMEKMDPRVKNIHNQLYNRSYHRTRTRRQSHHLYPSPLDAKPQLHSPSPLIPATFAPTLGTRRPRGNTAHLFGPAEPLIGRRWSLARLVAGVRRGMGCHGMSWDGMGWNADTTDGLEFDVAHFSFPLVVVHGRDR